MKKILLFLSIICIISNEQTEACETECKAYCNKECPADYWVCEKRGNWHTGEQKVEELERFQSEPKCPRGSKPRKVSCKSDCSSWCSRYCTTPTCSSGCTYNVPEKKCIGACRDKTVGRLPAKFNPESVKGLIEMHKK